MASTCEFWRSSSVFFFKYQTFDSFCRITWWILRPHCLRVWIYSYDHITWAPAQYYVFPPFIPLFYPGLKKKKNGHTFMECFQFIRHLSVMKSSNYGCQHHFPLKGKFTWKYFLVFRILCLKKSDFSTREGWKPYPEMSVFIQSMLGTTFLLGTHRCRIGIKSNELEVFWKEMAFVVSYFVH